MQLSKTFQFYNVYIEQKEELKNPDKTNKQTNKHPRCLQVFKSASPLCHVCCVQSSVELCPDDTFPEQCPSLPSGLVHPTDLQGDGGPFRELQDPG